MTKNILGIMRKAAQIILTFQIVVLFVIFFLANLFHFNCYMNSDIASEVLHAKVLYLDHFVYSKYWVGSAERYIISEPNIAAFIYSVTKNLLISSGMAACILAAALLISMIVFYHKIRFSYIQILLAVMLPFVLSENIDASLSMLVLYAAFYASHFIVLFIILSIYASGLQRGRITILQYILSVILAAVTGMQGFHCIIYIYIPLLITEMVRQLAMLVIQSGKRKRKKHGRTEIFLWSIVLLVTAMAVIICMNSSGNATSRNIRHSIDKLGNQVLPDIFDLFKGRMTVLVVFFMITAILGFCSLFIHYFHMLWLDSHDDRSGVSDVNKGAWASVVLLFSFLAMVAAATFTTTESAARYYVPLLFAAGAGTAFLIGRKQFPPVWLRAILVSVVIVFSSIRILEYSQLLIMYDQSMNTDEYHTAEWLKSSGYDVGYSTYDYANLLTVLSNDRIRVAAVDDFQNMNGCKWLTDKRWYPPIEKKDITTAYVVSDANRKSFNVFLKKQKPAIIDIKKFGQLNVFILKQNYTHWSD